MSPPPVAMALTTVKSGGRKRGPHRLVGKFAKEVLTTLNPFKAAKRKED